MGKTKGRTGLGYVLGRNEEWVGLGSLHSRKQVEMMIEHWGMGLEFGLG